MTKFECLGMTCYTMSGVKYLRRMEAAHHYVQRILEDFYDDRPSTLTVLRAKGRVPDEDKPAAST